MDQPIRHSVRIPRGRTYRLGRGGGVVTKGEAWVTMAGHYDDLILKEGSTLPCCHNDVVVQALSDELELETLENTGKSIGKIA